MARESQTTGSEGLSRRRELSRPDHLPGSDIWHPHGVVRPEEKHVWSRGASRMTLQMRNEGNSCPGIRCAPAPRG